MFPFPEKPTNFQLSKTGVEKFLRRVQLKASFHDKEDDSNILNKDTFETLLIQKSKWTPLKGQFNIAISYTLVKKEDN